MLTTIIENYRITDITFGMIKTIKLDKDEKNYKMIIIIMNIIIMNVIIMKNMVCTLS